MGSGSKAGEPPREGSFLAQQQQVQVPVIQEFVLFQTDQEKFLELAHMI